MNGYVCLWNSKRCEVEAETTFQAQQKAESIFQKMAGRKKVKRYDIVVMLAAKQGEQVTHLPLI